MPKNGMQQTTSFYLRREKLRLYFKVLHWFLVYYSPKCLSLWSYTKYQVQKVDGMLCQCLTLSFYFTVDKFFLLFFNQTSAKITTNLDQLFHTLSIELFYSTSQSLRFKHLLQVRHLNFKLYFVKISNVNAKLLKAFLDRIAVDIYYIYFVKPVDKLGNFHFY